MKFKVQPVEILRGSIELPASKSYSIRAFLVAACGGKSRIVRPSDCEDALVAMKAARALGARISKSSGGSFNVRAAHGVRPISKIYVQESGTVLRFILPLASLHGGRCTVTGGGTLVGRPNHFLLETLRRMGLEIRGTGEKESVPIRISGGALRGGNVLIDGTLSSQFISALLIAGPQLPEDTVLFIKGKKIVSETYITMTIQILKEAGIKIKRVDKNQLLIKAGQRFTGLKNYQVPSDYGLAAFMMAGSALIPSQVEFRGCFNDRFVQADGKILEFLKRMGMRWTRTSRAIKVKGPFSLRGGSFSLKDCPDLVPIMAVLALFAKGRTRLLDIAHARAKESDRIGDLKLELEKLGASILAGKDSLTITPKADYKMGVVLDPHHDHRLAMAFSIAGLKLGVTVKDIECTRKSYPAFVRDLRALAPGWQK